MNRSISRPRALARASAQRISVLSALLLGSVAAAQSIKPTTADFAKDFAKGAWSVETFVVPALTATGSNFIYPQTTDYGTGFEGWAHHYGVSVLDDVNSKFMRRFVFAEASGRLDRYCADGSGPSFTLKDRSLNVLGHSLLKFPRQGLHWRNINWSALPASLASSALSTAYQPSPQRTWGAMAQRFGINAGGYALGDAWEEFTFKQAGFSAVQGVPLPRGFSVSFPTAPISQTMQVARTLLRPR